MEVRLSGFEQSDRRLLLLAPEDNVMVAREEIGIGETILVEGIPVAMASTIQRGHKLARRDIAVGEKS